ncbi:phosphoribosylformylglycinamidine synthase [Selenomonadales bacterium OttesenSCG-928-I06]|nr:phosphoribosylformylglycinamidine synthase [Selenomonadales bacterium OttesenSCG-928-I06]
MNENILRIYVEKKEEFAVESKGLLADLKENLKIKDLVNVRVLNRYDIENLNKDDLAKAIPTVFSEPPLDIVYIEDIEIDSKAKAFVVESLPGQYDQRADSAAQCIEILTQKARPTVNTAKVIILEGDITEDDLNNVKKYYINPIETREASFEKPNTLKLEYAVPDDVAIIKGFIDMNADTLKTFFDEQELAMSFADLVFCQDYFRDIEKRDPSITEIKLIDTYWSDHCRHTTFFSEIDKVEIENGKYNEIIKKAYSEYLASKEYVYGDEPRQTSLMDIATISMKDLRKKGLLPDLDQSEEINASSIKKVINVDGREEEWLIMFKNETHNHPTEIEPFGGAATCLGGCIRDPLSGRSYVYQAMRLTGSGDPRKKIEETLPGKLPQRKITTLAAKGYSSYGNQVGLTTGQVQEIYDENFIAKRMEVGAVIGAAKRENVVREVPQEGDVVILVGGRTGRDGCGGATGSSKEHTEESLANCSAEVQKGNPVIERNIQRLFRKPEVSRIIKRCNDFGAGGVSVAIGELTDGLDINLDKILKKYEGLDGTELAISESQERMAVVVDKNDAKAFISFAGEENLEATVIATVTAEKRLKMSWREKTIVDISREFLNTSGIKQKAAVKVEKVSEEKEKIDFAYIKQSKDIKEMFLNNIADLNVCSQKGLVENFDSTVGANTILMPLGGIYQMTPQDGMVAKVPVLDGSTNAATIMTFGYNSSIAKWSPFHSALYAVVESVAKVVALGGNYQTTRLSLQEYFEKLGTDSSKWGKPFSALLGAFYAQKQLNIPAIGGKDSMSGTFKDINVPPVLASFAVDVIEADNAVSQEFKNTDSKVVLLKAPKDENLIVDFAVLKEIFTKVQKLIKEKKVLASYTVKGGGVAAAISKMAFGNGIGFKFEDSKNLFNEISELFFADYGSIILEITPEVFEKEFLAEIKNGNKNYILLGETIKEKEIRIDGQVLTLKELLDSFNATLENIFPTKVKEESEKEITNFNFTERNKVRPNIKIAKPRVFVPIFPGTNCEYDSALAFEKHGAIVETAVFRNFTENAIQESLDVFVKAIKNSQIIMFPGGFSIGDEPDGSGKFIAVIFRNPVIKEAISEFLNKKDGLMLGICNGFQALIKLGLVPYGEICDMNENSPTLTYNKIGRHVSCMVKTRVASTLSPWFNEVNVGDVFTIPASHGEGRFYATKEELDILAKNGQIACQYVDFEGNATYDIAHNPNGSYYAVEAITSKDGRVLGKMGHSERNGEFVSKNIDGNKDQKIFLSGVNYFR